MPVKFYLQHVRNDIGPLCFFRSTETDRQTAISCTSCTTDAMYMNFRVPRQLKVHHQLKRFNIQTTRSNISRNQYTGATVSKTYQGLIAIALLQIAV